MRDTAFVVATAFPILATVALAVILVAPTAVAVVPRCHCRAALALTTTVTVDLATVVTALSRCCSLICPRLTASPLLLSSQLLSQHHP